jgi:hypothetical protein
LAIGTLVRFLVEDLGASEEHDLGHFVEGESFGTRDTGKVAFEHPNQKRCSGLFYVEVPSKTEPARLLYVPAWLHQIAIVERTEDGLEVERVTSPLGSVVITVRGTIHEDAAIRAAGLTRPGIVWYEVEDGIPTHRFMRNGVRSERPIVAPPCRSDDPQGEDLGGKPLGDGQVARESIDRVSRV